MSEKIASTALTCPVFFSVAVVVRRYTADTLLSEGVFVVIVFSLSA